MWPLVAYVVKEKHLGTAYGMLVRFSLRLLTIHVPYFFGCKTEFFSFQNNPKDLDPSCKTDLDLWDCLGRVKLVLLQNFIGLI